MLASGAAVVRSSRSRRRALRRSRARRSRSLPPIRLRKRLRPADSGAPHRVLALSSARITRAIRRAHFHGLERVRRSALSAQRSPLTGCRQKECRSTTYDDFFSGFKFGDAAGFFATFEENLPVCGGFGSPRILIRLRPSPDLRAIMFPNCLRPISSSSSSFTETCTVYGLCGSRPASIRPLHVY